MKIYVLLFVTMYTNALFGCTCIYLNPHVLKWN
jgi:hypothetical protein